MILHVECAAREGQRIKPAQCLIDQWSEKCYCPRAREVVMNPPPKEEIPKRLVLMTLRARSELFFRRPLEQQYCGPARAARAAEREAAIKVEARPGGISVGTFYEKIERPIEVKEDPVVPIPAKMDCPRCKKSQVTQSLRRHTKFADGLKPICQECRGILGAEYTVKNVRGEKSIPLPDVADLPIDYLAECVAEAKRRRDNLNKLLGV